MILLAVLMLRANAARQAAAQAVQQCAQVVFPSLFPFCVVSRRLTASGALRLRRGDGWCRRWFGVPACGMGALAIGLCGGYPMAVATACGLYRSGQLEQEEAEQLLCFCNQTGPAIFFGMVGAVLFPGLLPCAVLYVIHILSALLTALLLAQSTDMTGQERPQPSAPEPETLPQTLRQSFFSVAGLCGYVIFFAVVLQLALELPPMEWLMVQGPTGLVRAVVSSLVDLPSGIAATAEIGNRALRFVLCAAGISWGGICVHMQARGIWQEAGLRPRRYLLGKLVQTLCALTLAFPAARLLLEESIPMWPGFVPIFAVFIKIIIDFFRTMRYNDTNNRTEAVQCCFVRSKNPAPTVPMHSK